MKQKSAYFTNQKTESKMITEIEKCKAAGMTDEEARLDAFRLVSHTAPAATKTERSAVNG